MTFDAAVEVWRDTVAQYAGELPVDALLAWGAEESDGNECGLGLIGHDEHGAFYQEAGFGQQYFETRNSTVGGVAIADLRVNCNGGARTRPLTDDERAKHVIALIADAARSLDTSREQLLEAGLTWTEPEEWCMAKLQHGLPAIASMMLKPAGTHAMTWRGWWQWIAALSQSQVAHMAPPVEKFGFHKQADGTFVWVGLARFAKNAETVGCAVGVIP